MPLLQQDYTSICPGYPRFGVNMCKRQSVLLLELTSEDVIWVQTSYTISPWWPTKPRKAILSQIPPQSANPSRGQLELRYPLPPPPLGCDRANFRGCSAIPAIPGKHRCNRYSYTLYSAIGGSSGWATKGRRQEDCSITLHMRNLPSKFGAKQITSTVPKVRSFTYDQYWFLPLLRPNASAPVGAKMSLPQMPRETWQREEITTSQ